MAVGTPPSGVVAFLFTDIEGSTALWEEDATAMDRALALHDRTLRTSIERHGGYVFSTAGDAFAAAFASVDAARSACIEVLDRLGGQSWPTKRPITVRIGLHAGEANERDGDYFGPTLNRAARIMAAANGGQALASASFTSLAGTDGMVDLGEHRLKDLAEPERLWQLNPGSFAPIRTLDARRHNLPIERSDFVGRAEELAALVDELGRLRLVTLLGPGGVGKTRLALHTAAELLDRFEGGVWFVGLAPLSDQRLIPAAFVSALELHPPAAGDQVEFVVRHLSEAGRTLVILDNCEHVIEGAASVADRLSAEVAGVTILTTSREPLHIDGEHVHPVDPLRADGTDAPAVELFWSRACATGRAIHEDDRARMLAMCRQLDGLPLAIELAASRVRSMTLDEIDRRLGERFRLLRSDGRGVSERHRSLDAALAWSFETLAEPTAHVFDRLSVCAGGFELDAAIMLADRDEFDVLDALDQLVDRSLLAVSSTVDDRSTRYVMLETMRRYGTSRLRERGELESARDRHLDWAADLARRAGPDLQLRDQDWTERIDRELANVRAALAWAESDALRSATGLQLINDLGRYWFNRTLMAEGSDWITRLLAKKPDLSPVDRARSLANLGFYVLESDSEENALVPLRESLRIAEDVGDPALLCQVLHHVSRAGFGSLPRTELLAMLEGGLSLARELQDPTLTYLHATMRLLWYLLFDPGGVHAVSEQYVADFDGASSVHVRSHVHELSALVAITGDDLVDARTRLRRAFEAYRSVGNVGCTSHALEALAWWLCRVGERERAASVLRDTRSLRSEHHAGRATFEALAFDSATAEVGDLQASSDEPEFDDLESAIDHALALLRLVEPSERASGATR